MSLVFPELMKKKWPYRFREFERQVQSDTIKGLGSPNPLLMLLQQLEAHILGIDGRLKAHFILKDPFVRVHPEANVIGNDWNPG